MLFFFSVSSSLNLLIRAVCFYIESMFHLIFFVVILMFYNFFSPKIDHMSKIDMIDKG